MKFIKKIFCLFILISFSLFLSLNKVKAIESFDIDDDNVTLSIDGQYKLVSDVTKTITIETGAVCSIDLNGHNVKCDEGCFNIKGTLVLNGNGICECDSNNNCVFVIRGKSLTINSGTYRSYGDDKELINIQSNDYRIFINGGDFDLKGKITPVCSNLSVLGGTFKIEGLNENANGFVVGGNMYLGGNINYTNNCKANNNKNEEFIYLDNITSCITVIGTLTLNNKLKIRIDDTSLKNINNKVTLIKNFYAGNSGNYEDYFEFTNVPKNYKVSTNHDIIYLEPQNIIKNPTTVDPSVEFSFDIDDQVINWYKVDNIKDEVVTNTSSFVININGTYSNNEFTSYKFNDSNDMLLITLNSEMANLIKENRLLYTVEKIEGDYDLLTIILNENFAVTSGGPFKCKISFKTFDKELVENNNTKTLNTNEKGYYVCSLNNGLNVITSEPFYYSNSNFTFEDQKTNESLKDNMLDINLDLTNISSNKVSKVVIKNGDTVVKEYNDVDIIDNKIQINTKDIPSNIYDIIITINEDNNNLTVNKKLTVLEMEEGKKETKNTEIFHFILIAIFVLYIAFVCLYNFVFKNKYNNINLITGIVAFLLSLVLGIIGHCVLCIIFIIINCLVIGLSIYYLMSKNKKKIEE